MKRTECQLAGVGQMRSDGNFEERLLAADRDVRNGDIHGAEDFLRFRRRRGDGVGVADIGHDAMRLAAGIADFRDSRVDAVTVAVTVDDHARRPRRKAA